jgi:hypothetical protein
MASRITEINEDKRYRETVGKAKVKGEKIVPEAF